MTREEINVCYWGDDVTQVAYDTVFWYRFPLLKKAHARSVFHEEEGYEKFCMESWYWLNDYALYMALKFHFDNQEWLAWPEDIRFRKRDAVERYKEELKEQTHFWKLHSSKFFQQWKKLRAYVTMPSSDVYVIAGEKRYMVPAVREFVREIRVDEGYVRLHLIEGMAIDEN